MYRAFLIDDESSVIDGLRLMIPWNDNGFEICGCASNGKEALPMLGALRPHLIITDIRMPEADGLALIREIRQLGMNTEIIILTGCPDFDFAREALAHGVLHYLLKPLDAEEISAALADTRKKLDGSFLAAYGFADVPETAEDYAAKLERAAELMNLEEVRDVIDQMLAFYQAANNPERALAAAHECCYRLAKVAYTRNVSPDAVLLNAVRSLAGFNLALLKTDFASLRESMMNAAESVIELLLVERKKSSHRFVHQAKETIDHNFQEDLSVSSLARMVYINPVYLGDAFKKAFGIGISEYLHTCRIQKAAELVRETKLKLTVIAETVGYKNYNKFFGWFERIMGMTPTQYVKQARNDGSD